MKNIPPLPSGWNKTLTDLYKEVKLGLRQSVEQPEFQWGWDYEKSLLPSNTRFPKGGDIYEAKENMELQYLVTFQAPYSDGGVTNIAKGDKFIAIKNYFDETPISIYAKMQNPKEIEKILVPEIQRNNSKFNGILFEIKTYDLNTKFKLISEPIL